MFRPIPMYETNAMQLHFLVRLFWYLSQWSDLICSIFCTRLYSKDILCGQSILEAKVDKWSMGMNGNYQHQVKIYWFERTYFYFNQCPTLQLPDK